MPTPPASLTASHLPHPPAADRSGAGGRLSCEFDDEPVTAVIPYSPIGREAVRQRARREEVAS